MCACTPSLLQLVAGVWVSTGIAGDSTNIVCVRARSLLPAGWLGVCASAWVAGEITNIECGSKSVGNSSRIGQLSVNSSGIGPCN